MDERRPASGTHRLALFEVVEVHDEPAFPAAEGVIVGTSPVEDDTAERWYAVSPPVGSTCMVEEKHLRETGRRVTRESIYDGSTARVTRHGELVDIDLRDRSSD